MRNYDGDVVAYKFAGGANNDITAVAQSGGDAGRIVFSTTDTGVRTVVTKRPFPESHVSLERLSDLRRRYWAEAEDLRAMLEDAQADLDLWSRAHCHLTQGLAATTSVSKLCDSLDEDIRSLERDLAEVQSAIQGIDDEIAELEARAMRARRHPRSTRFPSYLSVASR